MGLFGEQFVPDRRQKKKKEVVVILNRSIIMSRLYLVNVTLLPKQRSTEPLHDNLSL